MLCRQHMASTMRHGKCSALPLCMEGRSRDKGVLMGASAIDKLNYTDINASTIDGWVEEGWEWGTPISHEEFMRARAGEWSMVLTPTLPVPRTWFPKDLAGCRVLGLASGGGQQMPIMAACGAQCTVLDYSERQLASEQAVAQREGYEIECVRADMTRPLPFADETFDLIIHPVSNCYVEQVLPIWRECYRVLRPGGRLLAGLDNGFAYALDDACERVVRRLPYNPLRDPELAATVDLKEDGVQFSHTFDEQIRGQLQAGFSLIDCYEDTDGEGRLHDLHIPTFWATCAVKTVKTGRGCFDSFE